MYVLQVGPDISLSVNAFDLATVPFFTDQRRREDETSKAEPITL